MKLRLFQGSHKVWFTSDSHYAHSNICRGTTEWKDVIDSTRDFDTLEEMNNTLVDRINSRVGKKDILFHLGDWSFGGVANAFEFRERINCENIYLIAGNHDKLILKNYKCIKEVFRGVYDRLRLEVITHSGTTIQSPARKQEFILDHYPSMSWQNMNRGCIHLHGHVHLNEELKFGKGKMMDVGVDGNNLYPYSLEEITELMKDRPIRSGFDFDHHVKEVR